MNIANCGAIVYSVLHRYGIEGIVHATPQKSKDKFAATSTTTSSLVYNPTLDCLECPANGETITLFRKVLVQLMVESQSNHDEEVGSMRQRLFVALTEPAIPGLVPSNITALPLVRSPEAAADEERIVKRVKADNPQVL
jgi:hypothetical protein